jgi:hypothetical protein
VATGVDDDACELHIDYDVVDIETAAVDGDASAVVSYVNIVLVEVTGEAVYTAALAFEDVTLSCEAPVLAIDTATVDIERIVKTEEADRDAIEAAAMDVVATSLDIKVVDVDLAATEV